MAISIVSSSLTLNITALQSINHTINHTISGGSDRAYVFAISGLKNTSSDDFSTNGFSVTINGTSYPPDYVSFTANGSTRGWAAHVIVLNPPVGSNTIVLTNSYSQRAQSVYFYELNGVMQSGPVADTSSQIPSTDQTSLSFTIGIGSPAPPPGLVLAASSIQTLSIASEISATGSATLAAAGQTPGSTAGNDLVYAFLYKAAPGGGSTTAGYAWTTLSRIFHNGIYIKEASATVINKTYIGANVPAKYYVGTGQTGALYVGANKIYG